jgi:hypothetical protein
VKAVYCVSQFVKCLQYWLSALVAPEPSVNVSSQAVKLALLRIIAITWYEPQFCLSSPRSCTQVQDSVMMPDGAQPCCPILSSTMLTLLFTLLATALPLLSLYCPFNFTCFFIARASVLCWLLLSSHMILAVHSFSCGSVVWSLVADFVSGRSCSTVTLGCTLQRPITTPRQVQQ